MKLKKITSIILVSLFCSINFCHMEVRALFGNAHFNIGEKISQNLNLSKTERIAFLSGMVYADIGRFKFDKETGIDSDSDKFAERIEKLAQTDEEKWFAYGFRAHVFQDNETKKFLNDVLGHGYSSYSEYMIACGTLDSYFSKKSGILYNEFLNKFNFEQVIDGFDVKDLSEILGTSDDKIKDLVALILEKCSNYPKKNKLLLYANLIERTYKSLGFEVSIDEINEQAGNLLGVFIITSSVVENKIEDSEELASKIENSSDKLAKLCADIIKL